MSHDVISFALDRDDLNDRLAGGLPPGSLIILEGPYGAGKSILSQRIAYGATENDVSVCYVSTEMTNSAFLGQMQSLNFDVDDAVLDERLVFVSTHPVFGARAPRRERLRRILEARMIYTKDLIVFDTFSKFLADHMRGDPDGATGLEQVEATLHLFKRLTSAGRTIILTFEKGQVPESIAAMWKEAADVYFSIEFEVQGGSANRRIVVNRMSRARGRFGEIIGFRVEPGVGIVIEIKSVV